MTYLAWAVLGGLLGLVLFIVAAHIVVWWYDRLPEGDQADRDAQFRKE